MNIKIIKLFIIMSIYGCTILGTTLAQGAEEGAYLFKDQSKKFTIDRVYPSMFGPADYHSIGLKQTEEPELLWITGMKQGVVGGKGETESFPEHFCHGHLLIDYDDKQWEQRKLRLGNATQQSIKLFSILQGQEEVKFPKNFGIPVFSDEPFVIGSMVLNYDENIDPFTVQVNTKINVVRHEALTQPLKPLFRVSLNMHVPVKSEEHDSSTVCEADVVPGSDGQIHDDQFVKPADPTRLVTTPDGHVQSRHWYVPPGRHTYRYTIEAGTNIPYDTTAHFVAIHLHAFGEYLELVDLTTNEVVVKSYAKNYQNKRGIEALDFVSSEEGIKMHKDRAYELVAVYNNTMDEDIDAMAVMYMYLYDKNFDISEISFK